MVNVELVVIMKIVPIAQRSLRKVLRVSSV